MAPCHAVRGPRGARLGPALALALAIVLPTVSAAATVPGDWSVRDMVVKGEFEAFDAASLNLFDFDDDGWPEIVSSNDNNQVYVLSSRTGRILAEIRTTHPDGWNARDVNPVAIGDLYGDGTPCLVIPNSAAYLSAWCYDGRGLTGGFDFDRRWEIRVDAAQWDPDFHKDRPWLGDQQPSMDGNAYLADVDGEPGLEIFVETDGYPGQFSFGHDGSYRWHHAWHDGNAGAVVADLDQDGKKEAIFASDSGVVSVYDASSGKQRWSFDASRNGATPGSITTAPAVADLAGDAKLEMVFAARNAPSADPDGSHAVWFALGHDGGLLWKRSEGWMNPLAYTHPAIVDADGDGGMDVVALDWNTIGHKPGNWETTSRGPQLFALDGEDGAPMWHANVPAYWSNKDVVVVGGSVIVNAAQDGRDGLGVYDLRTGSHQGFFALPEGWEAMRGPVAAESDKGILLVVPLARPDPTPERTGLDVGDREGAIAIVSIGGGEIAWSANFHHSDTSAPHARGLDKIWWSGPVVLFCVVGGVAYYAWHMRRPRRA